TDMATPEVQATQNAPADGAAMPLPPGTDPLTVGENPMALGERVFRSATPACNACHSTAPGADMAGPSLHGLVARAQELVGSPDYKGQAKDVDGYIREAILKPSAHVVPGAMYSANGTSFMPNTYVESLKPEQVDHLTAYLSSLK